MFRHFYLNYNFQTVGKFFYWFMDKKNDINTLDQFFVNQSFKASDIL